MVQNQISIRKSSYYECGLQFVCGFVVMRNFITGGHCLCTIHREVSDILFQHKEL